ncbi:hypothetical protein BHM03_00006874 [Ensete ventricosum]|nr:hypothetical protein BHM03_00006874 [Ensete ventricosum]
MNKRDHRQTSFMSYLDSRNLSLQNVISQWIYHIFKCEQFPKHKPELILLPKVCNFDLYRPVWAIHTGPPGYRYVDRPLPGDSVKNQPSAINFGRRRPIEREIDRRRSIEEEKGKKKRKRKKKEEGKKEYLARAPSSPACRHRPRIAHGRGRDRFFSRVRRRRSVSQRGDIDRGDVAHFSFL